MTVKTCSLFCGLLVAVLYVGTTAVAQETSGTPEVVPAPPGTQPYRPEAKYDSLDAATDAHKMAEQQRRWAVDRQLRVLNGLKWYNAWGAPYVHRFALPYINAYAPPRAAERARGELRRLETGEVWGPRPGVRRDIIGDPYRPWIKQPIGHEKTWTGPNSYIYEPRYTPPEVAKTTPTPAARPTHPAALPSEPVAVPTGPVVQSTDPIDPVVVVPGAPDPPPRPKPPVDSGPREL